MILSHWKGYAFGLICVICFAGGWKTRGSIEAVKYAAALEESIKAQSEIIEQERQKQIKSNEVANALENKNRILNRNYSDLIKQLRDKERLANALPKTSNSTCEHYDSAGGKGLYGERAEALIGLMYQADLQTQQLIACQEWIKSQQ